MIRFQKGSLYRYNTHLYFRFDGNVPRRRNQGQYILLRYKTGAGKVYFRSQNQAFCPVVAGQNVPPSGKALYG